MTRIPSLPVRSLTAFVDRVEGAGRPQIRRRLDIQHMVIPSQHRGLALHVEIEQECEEGGQEASYREGGEGFVETADHYSGVVVPCCRSAAVAECPSEVPTQEAETEDPEDREDRVDGEVVFGG